MTRAAKSHAERMEERAERMRGNPYAKRRPVNSPPRVVVEDGATVERAPLRGPVYVRVHTHTHSHSTAMRHDTRTKLLQSWHVGMCGAPAELNARALGSELDYQMHLTDCALTLLNAKMRAHKEKLAGEPGNELATVVLREKVNESMVNQIEFFTQCTQKWAGIPIAHRLPHAIGQAPTVA